MYPEDLRSLVDGALGELRFSKADATAGIEEAMRYSLLAGGKRVRPVLALSTARALGADPARFLPVACAVELIHTYSLIHDDLPSMDDDELRRGRPTCHVVFGEDTAILAGDALFAEAMRLVCERQGGGPGVQVGILSELARASGVNGMVGGQFLDLREAGRESAQALRRVHLLKTGRLIAAAVRCALIYATPPPRVDLALRVFARELGLLFQIVDDILDASGSEEAMGKPVGGDARKGKVTYVTFYGLEQARALAGESHTRAAELIAAVPGPVEDLAALTELIYARQS